jgi:TolA-binding protein
MGATDPAAKLNKFIAGITAYSAIMSRPVPGLNVQEVGKEIFGHLGYADGSRFTTQDNPQVLQLQQQLQQAMGIIQQLQQKAKDKQTGHMVSLQKGRESNQTQIVKTQIQEEAENRRSLATHMSALMEAQRTLRQ